MITKYNEHGDIGGEVLSVKYNINNIWVLTNDCRWKWHHDELYKRIEKRKGFRFG